MKELIEVLGSANNVQSASYDTVTKFWTITFKKGDTQEITSENLIDFLENA